MNTTRSTSPWQILLLLSLLSACGTKYDYTAFAEIKDMRWGKAEPVRMEINITDNSPNFALYTSLRYLPQVKHKDFTYELSITAPSGKTDIKNHSIALRNAEGKMLGDVAGDIADIRHLCQENVKFEERGVYVFQIKHTLPPDELGGVMKVGVHLKKMNP